MGPRKALAIVTIATFAASLIVTIPQVQDPVQAQTQAQMAPMISSFCNAVRMGVAQGPQSGFCSFQSSPLQQPQQSTTNNGGNSVCSPQLQLSGLCSPSSGSSVCPTGSVFQNGFCVPTTTSTTPITCPIGSILQNGVCAPFTNPTQSAPIANAGPDQTVTAGTLVVLDGTGSYATSTGATISSYAWTQTSGPSVVLNGLNTATPTFIAPVNSTTVTTMDLTFSLTVTDSLGQVSQPDTVTVRVKS